LVRSLNEVYQLDFFMFENVTGLRMRSNKRRFACVLAELRRAGFTVWYGELDAANFGVSQRRRRLFVVGLNSQKFSWAKLEFPNGEETPPSVREIIGELPSPIYYRRGIKPADVPFHPNHWTMNPR